MKAYAGGGEPDEPEEDDNDQEEAAELPVVKPGAGMRELASRMAQGVPTQPDEASTTQPVIPPGGQVPATNKENAVDVRARLQEFLNKQSGGSDKMQELADLYKGQLEKQGQRPNMAGSNALVDHYYGTHLSQVYGKPPTPAEQTQALMAAQEAVNKSRQPVTSDLLKEYGSDNNAVGKEQANYYRGLNSMNHETMAKEKALDKMEDDMGKAMNPMSPVYGAGNNNLGTRLARARSAIGLIQQHPDMQLDPRELKDFALTTATMLSNQNRVPYELVSDITPKNIGTDWSKIVEYFGNHPEDTNTQEFVKRMMGVIQREQGIASHQIGAIQQQQGVRFNRLRTYRPQSHAEQMKAGQMYVNMPELDTVPGADAAGASGTAPMPGAKAVVNKKTGEKAWLMPDGSRKPRK